MTRVLGPTERMLATIADALPQLGLALFVGVSGLLVAFLLRRLAEGFARRLGLDALAERLGVARLLYMLQIRGGLGAVLANLIFVLVLLFTLSASAEIAGLPGVAEGVGTIAGFLPRLVSAGVVALFGFAAAEFASRLAEGLGRRRSDILSPSLAANIVYYLVLAVVLTTAVQHLGLKTGLVDLLIAVVAGSALGSLALALAFASRNLLQDVLCRPYVLLHLQRGASLSVGEFHGTVSAMGTVTVSIRTAEGDLVVLPYRRLLDGQGFRIHPGPP